MVTNNRYPDFIIGGAMKSGTKTLHSLLIQHPKIYIPNKEIFFFDIDDTFQHPLFIKSIPYGTELNYDKYFKEYEKWYLSFFNNSNDDQILGEDTTTYLASDKAPKRIAQLIPNVKLIFILRNPVERAYSHYWHLVSNGLTHRKFDDLIHSDPGTILQRGLYKEQLKRFQDYFPQNQIFVLIFENFIRNTSEKLKDVLKFIDINNSEVINQPIKISNKARVPLNYNIYLLINKYINSKIVHLKYQRHLPLKKNNYSWLYNINRVMQKILLSNEKKYPTMSADIRRYLTEYYIQKNEGLDSIIQQNLNNYWN